MPAETGAPESAASPTHIVSAFGYKLSPEYRTITNAVITEATYDRQTGAFCGAVYDHSGSLVIESVRPGAIVKKFRPADPLSIDRSSFSNVPLLPEAIYAGHYFFVWGHFLLETLSTAVLAPALPNVRVLFSPFEFVRKSDFTDKFVAHSRPLLRASGWDDRETLISSNALQVERLHVPQRLTAFGNRPTGHSLHPGLAQVFQRIRTSFGRPMQARRRVLVMRAASHRRRHPSEEAIYSRLSELGFVTILPERMTAIEQVSIFSSAECLVGFSGSALHNSVFMHPGSQVIEIGDDAATNAALAIQIELCRTCGQQHSFVPGIDTAPRMSDSIVRHVLEVTSVIV